MSLYVELYGYVATILTEMKWRSIVLLKIFKALTDISQVYKIMYFVTFITGMVIQHGFGIDCTTTLSCDCSNSKLIEPKCIEILNYITYRYLLF